MGFFQKMEKCDTFVILDCVKFKKNDFQNRNRFINRSGNEEWFTVPVEKEANSKMIMDVMTAPVHKWRDSIVKQIRQNLKHTLEEVYAHEILIDINMASIRWCMNRLAIEKPIVMASSLNPVGSKSELLVDICKKMNADKYVSGIGGRDYLETGLFEKERIEVEFFQPVVKNIMSALYNIRET
jgi:hypothetical protein